MENEIDKPTHYVGIGASAGGLEALQTFFSGLSDDTGAAYIIVQHLSPDFKSVMAELLSKNTNMPVQNVVDGTEVKADTVYLIPPRKNMVIAEGRLLLSDQVKDGSVNLPIDIFFRALAEDQRHLSIAIVLSGTGSDGSRGVGAIKEAGGLVIVQSPTTAQFDGMPFSALNTGHADIVAPVGEIPEKLEAFMFHSVNDEVSPERLTEKIKANDAALTGIFKLLVENSEIDFSQYKPATVARRIEQRLRVNQLKTLPQYLNLLASDHDELNRLNRDLLIGVTRFFRDEEPFRLLEERVIPDILDRLEDREPLRVWVAGCSTGEEAYSIAILIEEELERRKESREVKIFATDVDNDAIVEAANASFAMGIADDISKERLENYFTVKRDHLSLSPVIRKKVIFAVHNFIKDPPFSNIHLATCRNALIYLQGGVQRKVLNSLHFSLNLGGVLFLGSSENLGEISNQFRVIDERCKLYQKKTNNRFPVTSGDFPSRTEAPSLKAPSLGRLVRSHRSYDGTSKMLPVMELLLQQYVPPAMVLDESGDVKHIYGDVSAFTIAPAPGRFSTHARDFIQPDLATALSTALHRAKTGNTDVHYKDIDMRTKGNSIRVDMRVRNVPENSAGQSHFVVIFEQQKEIAEHIEPEAESFNQSDVARQRILDLEEQLKKNEEHLQVTVEELETTNEELQSSNEELMAANEELQSTNEELQSVNEELYTVNSEYQEKITELTVANSDLDNLLKATDIGILFLDEALLIRNFTPAARRYFNILPADIGRPFHHISNNLRYRGMMDDVVDVLEGGDLVEKEIKSTHGDHLVVKLTPYYGSQQRTLGAVVSVSDISSVRRLETSLAAGYERLRGTMGAAFGHGSHKARILLVDDDKQDRELITSGLEAIESLQCELVEASTIEEASKKLASESFDICFVDFELPDETSVFELVRESNKQDYTIAFILLANDVSDDIVDEALSLGVYDSLKKSDINPALLKLVLSYAMRYVETGRYLREAQILHAQ